MAATSFGTGADYFALNPYSGSGSGTASAQPTPAPAPAAPVGQVQTFAGYTPNYAGLITSDPGYVTAQTAAAQAASAAAAQRKAALQQAIIRYGGVPSGFTDTYGDVDAATQDAATVNQYSTLAGLKTNYEQSTQQLMQQLAARGALQSGDLGYGQNQLDQAYGQQQYDAANAMTDTDTSDLNAYTGVLNQNSQNLAGAVNSAETNVASNPAYLPQPASYADYAASESAQYGQPIYKDTNGTLYNSNGSIYTPGSAGNYTAPPTPTPSTPAPTTAAPRTGPFVAS
jgi:hypothetical protein